MKISIPVDERNNWAKIRAGICLDNLSHEARKFIESEWAAGRLSTFGALVSFVIYDWTAYTFSSPVSSSEFGKVVRQFQWAYAQSTALGSPICSPPLPRIRCSTRWGNLAPQDWNEQGDMPADQVVAPVRVDRAHPQFDVEEAAREISAWIKRTASTQGAAGALVGLGGSTLSRFLRGELEVMTYTTKVKLYVLKGVALGGLGVDVPRELSAWGLTPDQMKLAPAETTTAETKNVTEPTPTVSDVMSRVNLAYKKVCEKITIAQDTNLSEAVGVLEQLAKSLAEEAARLGQLLRNEQSKELLASIVPEAEAALAAAKNLN